MFKARTQMGAETIYEFNKAHSKNLLLVMEMIFAILGVSACLIFWFSAKDIVTVIVIAIVTAVVLAIYPPVFYKQLKKSTKKMSDKSPNFDESVTDCFAFDDELIAVTTFRGDTQIGSASIYYPTVVKITVFNDVMYVYISTVNAYVIKRSGMTEGDFGGLKDFLKGKVSPKKFIDKTKRQKV